MRFAFCIHQDVPRLDIAMHYPVFMRVMNGARYLCDEFHRLPDWHWLPLNHFVKLDTLDEIHAEVAATFALAHFMNGNDKWMVEAGSGFRLAAKALQVRFGRP